MCLRYKFLLFMGIMCICTATENPHSRSRTLQIRNNRSSQTVSSEMMAQINDRVSVLATLDQEHRKKLDLIEEKLINLDSSTNDRLRSIENQQLQLSKQLENVEYMQHSVQNTVGEVRNAMDVVSYSVNQRKGLSHVQPRQADASDNNDNSTLSRKLDALATFLASTTSAVHRVENTLSEFGTSLTKLTQLTRGAHRRLSNLSSRNQFYNGPSQLQPQYPGSFHTYGAPPPPPPFTSEPSSCAQASLSETSIQKIQVDSQNEPFYAICESADKGGWTVIQNRFDGSINFNRDWEEYKAGFGNLAGEFFIGLEKLHALTATALQELEIVMVDFKNETRTASYSVFGIASEKEYYALQILGKYSGTAGDSFSFQAGNKFSTFDNDNDGWVEGNCAQAHTGAWWYGACEMSNLNGQYLDGDIDASQQYQGMYWNEFHGPLYSLKSVQMKIRPIDSRDAL